MRNCLVVFLAVVLVCFCFWCIYLPVRGSKLAHPGVEIVQNTSSHCTSTPNGNQNFSQVEEVHRRSKRYLLFEKGAAVSVTTAVVKTILPGIPRGFNIICEESLYYDLPASLSLPRKDLMKPEIRPSSNQQGIKRKNGFHKYKIQNHGVQKFNDFSKIYKIQKYDFPKYSYTKFDPYLKRRRFRSADKRIDDKPFLDIEAMFFQQIESFAKRLGFNERYCIMRTVCESQHILFDRGQSLFHDVIRIILQFSLPNIKKNWKFFKSLETKNLMDCANLYGPHCKISFIDFFTNQIHGFSS